MIQQQYQNQYHHVPSFVCPLTMEIMEDPVMDQCGHTFERNAILHWIQQSQNNNNNHNETTAASTTVAVVSSSCCPISHKPLHVSDLQYNYTLAERIEKWKFMIDHEHDINDLLVCSTIKKSSSSLSPISIIQQSSTVSNGNEMNLHSDDENHNNIDDDDDDIEIGTRRHSNRLYHSYKLLQGKKKKRQQQQQQGNIQQQPNQYLNMSRSLSSSLSQQPKFDLMLLPQERMVLQQMKLQKEQHEYIEYKKLWYHRITIVCICVSMICIGMTTMILLYRYYHQDHTSIPN